MVIVVSFPISLESNTACTRRGVREQKCEKNLLECAYVILKEINVALHQLQQTYSTIIKQTTTNFVFESPNIVYSTIENNC